MTHVRNEQAFISRGFLYFLLCLLKLQLRLYVSGESTQCLYAGQLWVESVQCRLHLGADIYVVSGVILMVLLIVFVLKDEDLDLKKKKDE